MRTKTFLGFRLTFERRFRYLNVAVYRESKQAVRFILDRKAGWRFKGGRVLPSIVAKVILGPGAGYIGGRTAFAAFNSGSARWERAHRGGYVRTRPVIELRSTPIELGFTGNANHVPYVSH